MSTATVIEPVDVRSLAPHPLTGQPRYEASLTDGTAVTFAAWPHENVLTKARRLLTRS